MFYFFFLFYLGFVGSSCCFVVSLSLPLSLSLTRSMPLRLSLYFLKVSLTLRLARWC